MKTDYLWDKTGEDREVERLENALAAFRHRAEPTSAANAASVKPTAETAFSKRGFFGSFFTFKFAAPTVACAVLALIVLTVWLEISSGKSNAVDLNATVGAPVVQAISPAESVEKRARTTESKTSQTTAGERRRATAASFSARPIKSARVKSAPAKIQFTEEERYAYKQLKLALSIASSNLKLVKDKAESIENDDDAKTAAPEIDR